MRKYLLISVALLTACSTTKPKVVHFESTHYLNENAPIKSQTSAHYDQQRAGAAYRAPAYEYVLGQRAVETLADREMVATAEENYRAEQLRQSRRDTASNTEPRLITSNGRYQRNSYSVYELERWKRFCSHGRMSEQDWRFIQKHGEQSFPADIIDQCLAPHYNALEYRQAWQASCAQYKSKDNASYRLIRQFSKRPHRPCR